MKFWFRSLLGLAVLSGGLVGATLAAAPANASTPTPDCPATIHCTFDPAAYQENNGNKYDYSDYDQANRPQNGMPINQIVIHDIEGSCQDAIAEFKDPTSYISAHYVECADASVVQMVEDKNVAWTAGNLYVNTAAINIEIAGNSATGQKDYTPKIYLTTAALVRHLAAEYHIPLDRDHIIGHENVPPPNTANVAIMHTDPGPYWNWAVFMLLLRAPVPLGGNPLTSKLVTVAPVPWSTQLVTNCAAPGDVNCPPAPSTPQPSNFVYIRTGPNLTAPLLTDPYLGQGTTAVDDVTAKAFYGQKFAAIQRTVDGQGIWYQVYYQGQTGWIDSPFLAPTVFGGSGGYVTPRPGLASIPVYGRAYPEPSAYPAGFVGAPTATPLPYTIPAGQVYALAGTDVPVDWYNNATFDYSDPYDHVNFVDTNPAHTYVRIQYGARQGYVKKSDLTLVS